MNSIEFVQPQLSTVKDYFDRIARRYDFLNTILSFGRDRFWREKLCDLAADGRDRAILDLGAGTGKLLEVFLRRRHYGRAVALDFSTEMLAVARRRGHQEVKPVRADFHRLPFPDASFDLVVSAFTLRSVQNPADFVSEIFRVLTPSGRAALLDLTRPKDIAGRFLYEPYLLFYLPWAGRLLTGSGEAYRFLAYSIYHSRNAEEISGLFQSAGFSLCRAFSLTFGIATLVIANK